jgi:Fur family transcriptional regulator, ferric uptake regulator
VQRDTAQRRAIRGVFRNEDRPLTPQEVLEGAQGAVPKMGLATVYRTLKSLTETGAVNIVDVPGEPQRYELAGKGHHHHFSCRTCGRMFEMDGCPGDLERMVPKDFVMEEHEVFIYGRCSDCR